MGTFTIIILIIVFIAGLASRSKPTITLDNDNHHLFPNPRKHHNPSINKNELMDEIKNEYDKENYREVIRLCEKYIYYYNEGQHILFLLTNAQIKTGEYENAKKNADMIMYRFDSVKWGTYLHGQIEYYLGNFIKANELFDESVSYGLNENSVSKFRTK